MDGIFLDVAGLKAPFEELERRGRSLSHLMPVVSEILRAGVDDVYDAEGPGWDDLKESTKKARRGSSYKILQDTGIMAQYTMAHSGQDWAEAFSGAAYGEFHATGTKNEDGSQRMPIRNPFDLGQFEDGVLAEIADLLLEDVAE